VRTQGERRVRDAPIETILGTFRSPSAHPTSPRSASFRGSLLGLVGLRSLT
jgi:hypothetical protein